MDYGSLSPLDPTPNYILYITFYGAEESMASTSSTNVTTKRDTDPQVLSPILEKLDEESLKRLEPFTQEIEEQIQQTVSSVTHKKLRHRCRDGVLSAAIYDTFLLFEKRTKVRVRSEFIADCLGVLMSVVNQNW